jgi:uncharacterized protein (DUF1330 family)
MSMKTQYVVAMSVIAGICIGFAMGGAAPNVNAQTSRTPVYLIGENDVSNLDGYMTEYAPKAGVSIRAHGGRYVAAAAGNAITLVGDPPKARFVVIAWDSTEQLMTWFNSPEYRAARQIGEKYAKYRNFIVPGVPAQ